jgi:hypothetical protein
MLADLFGGSEIQDALSFGNYALDYLSKVFRDQWRVWSVG